MKFSIVTALVAIILATPYAYAKKVDEKHAKPAEAKTDGKSSARKHKKPVRQADVKRHKARRLSKVGFSVQSEGYTDLRKVEQVITTLKKNGRDAFYYRGKDGGYIIRIGDFTTRRAAIVAGNKLKSGKIISGYAVIRPGEAVTAPPAQPAKLVAKKSHTDRYTPPVNRQAGPVISAAPKPVKNWWETRQPSSIDTTQAGNLSDRKPGNGVAIPAFAGYSGAAEAQKEPAVSGMGVIAARTAERFVGIPYLWGGNNVVDGLDCSGFVRAVYNLCGFALPRVARDQYQVGEVVALEQIKEGDLIFFGPSPANIKHVGMYVGGGQFVHAPKRGDVIRITSIRDEAYAPRMMGIRRFF